MAILRFIDYVTKEDIVIKTMDVVPRKGEQIFFDYADLPSKEFYVHQLKWEIMPGDSLVVKVYLENAKGYD